MTEQELKELGLTAEQYADFFGSDDQAPVTEQTETVATETVAESTEQVVEQPVEEKAPVAKSEKKPVELDTSNAMTFQNVKKASELLIQMFSIRSTCAVDSIYRALRGGTHITHGYSVSKNEQGLVVLTPVKK